MDYQEITVWTVIKRFLAGWVAAGLLLVIISCMKYREYIAAAFTTNAWTWIDALMPAAIIIFGIVYMLKSLFGRL